MKIAIQGELGSNSHMAALAMLKDLAASGIEILPCAVSAEVFERVITGGADAAVLPIENSLHGSVAEHYDLLLSRPIRIARESLLRIRHNLIARPGVAPEDIKRVLSHPVALSQCRHWLAARPWLEVVNFYDTAGSVKHVMTEQLDDTAGIAPELAARQYGAEVLEAGIEDHAENFTRFHLLLRDPPLPGARPWPAPVIDPAANKASLAFSVEHRPGALVRALEEFAQAGVNLTKIESRPVPGSPWEYVFFVDLRFDSAAQIDTALVQLARHCHMLKELGRYVAA
ncbi:MAG TPA: prephenate dehydratase [Acidobacteriaceae bacterium]|nr:prephenate dehydratase [Acidobacteriaceae bacterium]